ncbi:protogenin B-like [Mya arenaria]|uniref:protogenin B-like n=1 Tax=Mya arenaria TaxID=6604 RepID=UPI0022E977A2|nr:protogenin B-like [Mya arenaria]
MHVSSASVKKWGYKVRLQSTESVHTESWNNGLKKLKQGQGIERKFTAEPLPQNVPRGGVARFTCQIEAVPPAIYVWERDGKPLPQNNRYFTLNSGILQITGVQADDAGLYRCYATQGSTGSQAGEVHDIESRYSQEAELIVDSGLPLGPAKIVGPAVDEVTVRAGQPTILECLVQGYTGAVHWTQESMDAQGRTVSTPVWTDEQTVMYGSNLQIVHTHVKQAGTYVCRAGTLAITRKLHIISKPVILSITPEGGVRKPNRQWVYVRCEFEGHPRPTITWLKDGVEVTKLTGTQYKIQEQERELAIVLGEVKASGYYQCVASNEAGSVSAFTHVEFYMNANVPSAPQNLRVRFLDSRRLRVTWDPPTTGAMWYIIHYSNERTGIKAEVVSMSTNHDLGNLDPYTNYTISVTPASQNGIGVSSDQLVVTTMEEAPERPPSVTLEPHVGGLHVSWEVLPAIEAQGVITGYTIYVRKQGGQDVTEITLNGTVTSHAVNGLEPGTDYEVRAIAFTSVPYYNSPPFSLARWPWVPVTTETEGTGDFTGEEPILKLRAVNSSTLDVTWAFNAELPVSSFMLELRVLPGGRIVQSHDLSPAARAHVFYGLVESQLYEVKVRVVMTTGEETEVVQEVSLVDLPRPPVPFDVSVTLVLMTSLQVDWQVVSPSLEVSQFTVKYSRVTSPDSQNGSQPEEKFIISDVPSVLISDLQPATTYQISVRSHVDGVAGSFSPTLYAQTAPEGEDQNQVPSEPQNLRVQTLENGQVSVAWQPPRQPNGQIRSYTVYYTNKAVGSEQDWQRVVKNGSENRAVITVTGGNSHLLYVKVQANTDSGPGEITSPVSVNTSTHTGSAKTSPDNRTLGIIIGVSIGLFCIIICVIIILLRNRCFGPPSQPEHTSSFPRSPGNHCHNNGHLPGNGNGHAHLLLDGVQAGSVPGGGIYEMAPMLPENEHSDSKGGGTGNVILTPNGAKLNGFVPLSKRNGLTNGKLPNGHMTFFPIHHQYSPDHLYSEVPECESLMAEMLGGGGTCLPHVAGDESRNHGRCEDSGSLDNIDASSNEDTLRDSRENIVVKHGTGTSEGDSGAGSYTSSDRNSTGYNITGSIGHQHPGELGEGVTHCADSGLGVPGVAMDTGHVMESAGSTDVHTSYGDSPGSGDSSRSQDLPLPHGGYPIPQLSMPGNHGYHGAGTESQRGEFTSPTMAPVSVSNHQEMHVLPLGTQIPHCHNESTSCNTSQARQTLTDSESVQGQESMNCNHVQGDRGSSTSQPSAHSTLGSGYIAPLSDTPQPASPEPGTGGYSLSQGRRRHPASNYGNAAYHANGAPPQLRQTNSSVRAINSAQEYVTGHFLEENSPTSGEQPVTSPGHQREATSAGRVDGTITSPGWSDSGEITPPSFGLPQAYIVNSPASASRHRKM